MPSDRSQAKRRVPKQARSRATWEAIVEAAAQILERRGAEALNTNDVAERAGVSIGTLYQYFPDKRAILVAAARRELGAAPLGGRQSALIQAMIEMLDTLGRFGAASAGKAANSPTSRAPATGDREPRSDTTWERRWIDRVRWGLGYLAWTANAAFISLPLKVRAAGVQRR